MARQVDGDEFLNGKLTLQAGGSTDDVAGGGVQYTDTTEIGNSAVGTTDFYDVSIPANTLAVNNQSIWFEASGYHAATPQIKTLTVQFGGSTISTTVNSTGGLIIPWKIRGRIFRTGSTSVKYTVEISLRGEYVDIERGVLTAVTLSNLQHLKIQGACTSNSNIVAEDCIVGWDNANT